MRDTVRRYWFLFPVLASLATQCEESPRGAVPTSIVRVEIVLTSVPAGLPADLEELENCLDRLGDVGNHVRPSWRNDRNTPAFDPEHVPLVETSPNTFVATFLDVPSNTQNTLTVHDENECRRNPVILGVAGQPGRLAEGRVTEGVTANGTPITTVVGNDALLLVVRPDGTLGQ